MQSQTRKRMIIMVIIVVIALGLLVGFNLFKAHMIKQYMASQGAPVQTVSAAQVQKLAWQPQLQAVGSLRAGRGADLALDVSGLVTDIAIQSGDEVKAGQLILKLRDTDGEAALNQARAAAALAKISFDRASKQLKTHTIARAVYDNAQADLRVKQAAVQQQAALVAKKELHAPFDGRAGIITISPGTYLNAGTKVVTLQQLDPVFVDFNLPQKELASLSEGQSVHVSLDSRPDQAFDGVLTAIDPKVDTATRNVMVEARLPNPDGKLVPGMFSHVRVDIGSEDQRLTLPQTAITYNPYGSTVFKVEEKQVKDKDGKTSTQKVARQTFVTTGETRGDQVAVTKGLKVGDMVVTSGQLKLKNDTPIKVDNSVEPANDPNPTPREQ
ncbi:MAG: efflux RND transporter periplasmic adaptor subunit [Rhodanobacteraceae bacterium]